VFFVGSASYVVSALLVRTVGHEPPVTTRASGVHASIARSAIHEIREIAGDSDVSLIVGLYGVRRTSSPDGPGSCSGALPLPLLAALPRVGTALVLLALVGVGVTLVDVSAVTLLQRAAPTELLGHALGVVQGLFVGSLGIGTLLAATSSSRR
jgi:hypothetical protein